MIFLEDFNSLESLLKNRNFILELIKDEMPQTDDVKELAGAVESFYTRHILKECRNLALDTDNLTHADDADDCAEVDYEKD